jgi:hypothetical protein
VGYFYSYIISSWGFSPFEGDGNGFKLGGGDPDVAGNHIVKNCIAFNNFKKGFIDNGNLGQLTLTRNTAWNNGDTGIVFKSSKSSFTGNLAVSNTAGQSSLTSYSTNTGNSWNSGTWTNSSLASLDPTTLQGPRQSSGAIATSKFLVPVSGQAIGSTL